MAACRHEVKNMNEAADVSDMRLPLLSDFQSQRFGQIRN